MKLPEEFIINLIDLVLTEPFTNPNNAISLMVIWIYVEPKIMLFISTQEMMKTVNIFL